MRRDEQLIQRARRKDAYTYHMRLFHLLIFSAMASACTSVPPLPPVDFPVTVTIDPCLPKWGESRTHYRGGEVQLCEIILKRYPVCLLHELRHCIEGDWHPRDEPNTEDC